MGDVREQLEACPHCGSGAELKSHDYHSVSCKSCFCGSGICATPEIAIAAWNTRLHPPADEAVIERVARILEPQAWTAIGTGDTLAYRNRRTSSLRKAKAALNAIQETVSHDPD